MSRILSSILMALDTFNCFATENITSFRFLKLVIDICLTCSTHIDWLIPYFDPRCRALILSLGNTAS